MKTNLKTFKKNLVLENTKIITAIKILNQIKYKTLIIIDKKKKVIGSVTDGDIRRGLLKGFDLNQNIKFVAEKNSIKKTLENKVTKKIDPKYIDIIPVVNKFGVIKDLEIIDDRKKSNFEGSDNLEVI